MIQMACELSTEAYFIRSDWPLPLLCHALRGGMASGGG